MSKFASNDYGEIVIDDRRDSSEKKSEKKSSIDRLFGTETVASLMKKNRSFYAYDPKPRKVPTTSPLRKRKTLSPLPPFQVRK